MAEYFDFTARPADPSLLDKFWCHQTEVARQGSDYEVWCNECEWSRFGGSRSAYGWQRDHTGRPRNAVGQTERQRRAELRKVAVS